MKSFNANKAQNGDNAGRKSININSSCLTHACNPNTYQSVLAETMQAKPAATTEGGAAAMSSQAAN